MAPSLYASFGRSILSRTRPSKLGTPLSRAISITASDNPYGYRFKLPRYVDPWMEHLDDYCPGGLHPVVIGEVLGSRYKVVHKLGMDSSTVWLARDQQRSHGPGSLVTVNVMSANVHADLERPLEDPSTILQISDLVRKSQDPAAKNIRPVLDHFTHEGPNGLHHCLVSQFMGPCVPALRLRSNYGYRLRSDAARGASKRMADALRFLHSEGIVHGSSSVVLQCC